MSEHLPLALPGHEELSRLARDDPQAYEALRRELIDDLIDHAPDSVKPRLLGIQFRVDALRRLSRSTLGSTIKIYKLMWESFLSLNSNWQDLVQAEQGLLSGQGLAESMGTHPIRTARVLQFRPNQPPHRGASKA